MVWRVGYCNVTDRHNLNRYAMTPPTITLKKKDLMPIHQALVELDKPTVTIIDGKETRKPLEFTNRARYVVMRNLKKIVPLIKEIEEQREMLASVHNPGGKRPNELTEDKTREWNEAHKVLMNETVDVVFVPIKLVEFQLSKNPSLNLSVFQELIGPIIEDEGEEPKD